jgi:MFS transporter, OFA family, oxalate/formate antiporter
LTNAEILKSKKFWLLYFMNFCSVFFGYLVLSNFKVFGSQYISDDLSLTTIGSIATICGSIARFTWPFAQDYLGYEKVYGLLVLINFAASGFFYSSVTNPMYYGILVSTAVFCEGGHFVMLPAQCVEVWKTPEAGMRAYALIYSCLGMSCVAGGLVQNLFIVYTEDSFWWLWIVACLLNLVSLVLLCFYINLKKSKKETNELLLAQINE